MFGRKQLADVSIWSLNTISSVSIIMLNKQLMGSKGYQFSFGRCAPPGITAVSSELRGGHTFPTLNSCFCLLSATTLCGLHFLCTSSISLCAGSPVSDATSGKTTIRLPRHGMVPHCLHVLGFSRRVKLLGSEFILFNFNLLSETILFVVVAGTSIVSLNLSLMLNSVGFYQVCKLMQIPGVCIFERLFMGRTFSNDVIVSIGLVLFGVGVATVSDVEVNALGSFAAIIAVVTTSAQQFLVGYLQMQHNVSSTRLLADVSPLIAAVLLLLGPLIDANITGNSVYSYNYTPHAVVFLALTCMCAVLVNFSSFACIGRFSAVSFQVIGHMKTCLVFLFGWLLFSAPVTPRMILGSCFAVTGMILYSRAKSRDSEAS